MATGTVASAADQNTIVYMAEIHGVPHKGDYAATITLIGQFLCYSHSDATTLLKNISANTGIKHGR